MNNKSKYNPKIHHRKSIRLKGYDYSQAGLYFITICTKNRKCLFGHIKNGEMILNSFGEIAANEWQKTERIRKNCVIHEFIMMPNHLHGIIEIIFEKGESNAIGKFKSPFQTIGSVIRGFKIATIKRIKEKILEEKKKNKDKNNRTGELQFAPTAPMDSEKSLFTNSEKSASLKIKALDFKIWQRNYYEHIIRNDGSYQHIADYIRNNPSKWNDDKFYQL